jgi:peptidoglycan-associated lipoprotein
MSRRDWRWILTVVLVLAVFVTMTACARKTGSTSGAAGAGTAGASGGTGPGGSSGSGAGSGMGSGMAGGAGGMGSGSGSGAGGGSGSSLAGGGAVTGTTLPALPSPREFSANQALKDVHFEFDQYEVRSEDRTVLDSNARWLKENARALLLIEGHADERGTNEYNLALGERRAKATRDYLVRQGVDASRITMTTYGEERPVCKDAADPCWAQNRRAHFLIKQ